MPSNFSNLKTSTPSDTGLPDIPFLDALPLEVLATESLVKVRYIKENF